MTAAVFFQPADHCINGCLLVHAIQEAGIDVNTIFCPCFNFDIAAFQYRNDFKIELLGEFIVSCVVGRNCHDGTCSIACQYIVRNPDRDLLSIDRIDRIGTCKYTCLILVQIRSFQI